MNVFKRFTLLVGLLLAGLPSLVSAYQILPNPNPAGSTIYINSIDAAENFIDFANYGSILMGYGNTLNNFAKLDNFGEIDFGNQGLLNNTSTLNTASSGKLWTSYLSNSSTGTVNNSGDMRIFSTANNAGTINNSGFFMVFEGTLNNTGTVTNDNILSVHHSSLDNAGTLQNNGSMDNDAYVYNTGTITGTGTYSQINEGSKTINNGVLTQSTIHIYEGSLSGTGIVNGNVFLDGGPFENAMIAPGNSTGTFTINGNLTSSGTLDFEIGGLGAGEFDVLHINGDANFNGGNLEFDFVNGFTPAAGNSFDFLAAHNIIGWNTLNITLNGLDPELGGHFTRLDNGDIALFITEMPEPGTNALLLAGLGLLGFAVRHRKSLVSQPV